MKKIIAYYFKDPLTVSFEIQKDDTITPIRVYDGALTARLYDKYGSNDYDDGSKPKLKAGKYKLSVGDVSAQPSESARVILVIPNMTQRVTKSKKKPKRAKRKQESNHAKK